LIIGSLTEIGPAANPFLHKMPQVLWVLAILSHWTVVHRIYHTWRELREPDRAAVEAERVKREYPAKKLLTPVISFRTDFEFCEEGSRGRDDRNSKSWAGNRHCPCCGASITRGVRECGCGARFVGEPLDEAPLKVQRLGPAMNSVLLLAILVSASLAFTPWLAFGAVVVLWSSWRAVKLARRNPNGTAAIGPPRRR
jgi:hypothetical protein